MHMSRTGFVLFILVVLPRFGWAAADDLVIHEIMYHWHRETLDAEDLGAEYIELFNRSAEPISLTGWRFNDGVTFVFPAMTLPPRGYLVVSADPDTFRQLHPDVGSVLGPWEGHLSNAGERIALNDASGALVDEVRYADSGDWSVRELGPEDYGHRGWRWRNDHDGDGGSLELVNPALPNECGANWAASSEIGGTPGRANSNPAVDIAPLIADVAHTPEIPSSIDPVTVTARVVDEALDDVSVYLQYRRDRSTYVTAGQYPEHDTNEYTTLVMFDDGAHQDGAPDDGVYGAMIPAQSDRAVVEFYIEAVDAAGRTRTWPAPSLVDDRYQQMTNALYQVDDALNPYDYWTAGAEPLYYVVMTEAERGRLAYIGSHSNDSFSRAQMNATFISIHGDGVRCRYNVGVRNRGNGSRRFPPNNYRVNFPSGRAWKDSTAININSKYTYNQVVGNAIFHMAGLPAPEATRVQVRINGENLALNDPGRMHGSYAHIEVYDSDWAQRHLPDDDQANVYSGVSRGRHSDLEYRGENPDAYSRPDHYAKATNAAVNDWSDLIELTYALDRSSDDVYVQSVEAIVDVDQWCRWFALEALLVNRETNLSSGFADDYYMYCGVEDRRFVLLPHDLDTILSAPRTSIWLAGRLDSLPAVKRFLTHPEFVPRYYAHLKDLAETVFAPEQFDPLIDRLLDGWLPQDDIDAIKAFAAARRGHVLSVIPTTFTIESDLDITNGFHTTSLSSLRGNGIYGTADAITTRSVLLNGQPIQWSQRQGLWSLERTIIDLTPGINRLTVEAFDGLDGRGSRVDGGYLDIWYDDRSVTSLSGTLSTDRVLDAASGPWYVADTVTVPAGVTLEIEPGTTLFFAADGGLVVQQGGRLLARGTPEAHIHMTRLAGISLPWSGVTFDRTLQDNQLAYVNLSYGGGQGTFIDVQSSRLLLDHVTWGETDMTVLSLDHPTVTARDCVFPAVREAPAIYGFGLADGESFVFERCTFNAATGDGDVIDFTGGRLPGPILQLYDCLFLGGRGNGLCLSGADAYIEGSIFTGFHRDPNSVATSTAIVAGPDDSDTTTLWAVRNVFADNDRAVQLRAGSFLMAENNTFITSDVAALSFGQPPEDPAAGLCARGNIFWDNGVTFEHFFDDDRPDYGPQNVLIDRSLLPLTWHVLGQGNIDANPLFEASSDYHLRDASAARQAGPWSSDMGAYVPGGVVVSGEPASMTHRTKATLIVGGPGITHYVYSLNDPAGPWSDERSVDVPIELSGLRDGDTYTVYVLGKNAAGRWQDEPNASRTWTVDVTSSRLVISEVLASNETAYEHEGTYPDLIELYYDGPGAIDLSGFRLTDDESDPDKFVFSSGSTMGPGEYLTLYADSETGASGIHLGFALKDQGEEVVLYNREGQVVDSVIFGNQLSDLSIGRVYHEGTWRLTVPTFGQANFIEPLGDIRTVKISEWLAGEEVLFAHDFIELYNAHPWPVDIGGSFLTDDLTMHRDMYEVRPLTFIAGHGFLALKASGEDTPGHVDFSLSLDGEQIGLFGPDLAEIDRVIYGPQTPDVSQGRSPDDPNDLDYFLLPTPDLANYALPVGIPTWVSLISEDAAKRVIVPAGPGHVADDWNSNPAFDDSDWLGLSGLPGAVGYDIAGSYDPAIGLDVEDQMYGVNSSCYIRIPFDVDPDWVGTFSELELSLRYDDGFVVYLNGTQMGAANFVGTPQWDSETYVNHESLADEFDLVLDLSEYVDLLVEGDNLLAIHALNGSPTSSDFLISAVLDGAIDGAGQGDYPYEKERALLDGLRLTELMYHAPVGSELDFIELQNISDVTLDLTDVRFTDGVGFTFDSMTLDPGQYVVVVDDIIAFRSFYGNDALVAGEYSGHLANGGERIVLQLASPMKAAILRFSYDDNWYPATDGEGQSLIIEDVTAAPVTWNDSANWRASAPSPGGP